LRRWVGNRLRWLAHAHVAPPLVVAVALLAYVISIAVVPESGDRLWRIVQSTWWVVLPLTFPYLALRALVWRGLLEHLGIKVPWRPMLVSFASGEITKSLPAGVYVQNYFLARLQHSGQDDVARASMATTAMLGLEAAVIFPVGLILGWPGQPWVRWALLGVAAAWIVVLGLAWLLVRYGAHRMSERTPGWIHRTIRFLEEFLGAGREFLTWRIAWYLVPTALYVLIYAVDLYVIIRALGIHHIGFLYAVGIYALVSLANILVPIPTEVGLTEFAGLMAIVAYGIPRPAAAIIMLGLRALATGATIIVSGALIVFLRDQLSSSADGMVDKEPGAPEV
jgi:uncharacterized membrane protein YbhN (UPF0104 family)